MARNPRDDRQQSLPLAEAEGIDAERKAKRKSRRSIIKEVAAAQKIKLAERELLMWISNIQDHGDLVKSMDEIASYGNGLCCDVKTARKIVHRLIERGWIVNEEQSDGKPLRLRLDLEKLRAARGDESTRNPSQKREGSAHQTPPKTGRGRATKTGRGRATKTGSPPLPKLGGVSKEYSSSYPSNTPLPPQDADAWAAAAAALKEAKVFAIGKAIAMAKAHRLEPTDVVRIVREYRVNTTKFRPNPQGDTRWAILKRIEEGIWPTPLEIDDPDVVEERLAQREKRIADKQAEDAAAAAAAKEKARQAAEQACEINALFELLDDAERDELAARAFARNQPFAEKYRRGEWRHPDSLVRGTLLATLERELRTEAK